MPLSPEEQDELLRLAGVSPVETQELAPDAGAALDALVPGAPKPSEYGALVGADDQSQVYNLETPSESQRLLRAPDEVTRLYSPEGSAPFESTRYEQEFVGQNYRPSSDDYRRAWIVSLFDKERARDMQENLRYQQKYYDEGLNQARAMDRQAPERGRKIDLATAQAIAATGLVTPAAAAKMTTDSPLLAKFMNGLYSAGIKLAGQTSAERTGQQKETGLTGRNEADNAVALERAKIAADAQLEAAKLRGKKKGGGGGGSFMEPVAIAGYLKSQHNISDPVAQAVATGADTSTLPPEEVMRAKEAVARVKAMGPEKFSQSLRSLEGRMGTEMDRAGVLRAAKQGDPVARLKLRNEWSATDYAVKNAWRAYKKLSPTALEAITKLGISGTGGLVARSQLSGPEQAELGQIMAFVNSYIKSVSGASVTGNEWTRLSSQFGLGEGITPFGTPDTLERFLRSAIDTHNIEAGNINSEYPGLLEDR